MSDQCKHCNCRGNLPLCLASDCFQHENWMVIALKEYHQQLIVEAVEKSHKRYIDALVEIKRFGHNEGHGRGFTCATIAEKALNTNNGRD